ncbi:hypothetical protein TWF694_002488 [Orbilia ellipsospora]|uniref:Replication factor A protein 3 n=1 Tax=Orbilia ellipsospora TaxID=2528407 RepID=A0AAV9X283_9PEZI
MTEPAPTPRVNATLLSQFPLQTVRIIGKVLQIRPPRSATIDSQGTVALTLENHDTQVTTVNNFVEIIGKVNQDGSIQVFASTDFGPNVDVAAVEAVVQATHTYPEIFYDRT